MKRIGQLFGSLLVVLVLLGAVTTWWVMRPLTLTNPTVDISIEPQTTVRGIAQVVADSGVNVEPFFLYGFFRISGQSRKLRAGSYEINQGESVLDLLRKLSRGEESLKAVGLIDGWTFKQFRAALAKAPKWHWPACISKTSWVSWLWRKLAASSPEARITPKWGREATPFKTDKWKSVDISELSCPTYFGECLRFKWNGSASCLALCWWCSYY